MAQYQQTDGDQAPVPAQGNGTIQNILNWTGAALSVALIGGLGVWGYDIIKRDVSGIPVVRAVDGPMRVQPEDPGGLAAQNQGLAVNTVAAVGEAEGPADRIVLAPRPVELAEEDAPGLTIAPEPVYQTGPAVQTAPDETPGALVLARASDGIVDLEELTPSEQEAAILALADQLAANTQPITGFEPEAAEEPEARPRGGLVRSLRPMRRPESLQLASLQVPAAVPAPAAPRELQASAIPPGTRLVQLGAFDSIPVAKEEWRRLAARFDGYFDGKGQVIQKASSGGRTFYRLRAEGFADLSDARRFCAELVAGQSECIPVLAR